MKRSICGALVVVAVGLGVPLPAVAAPLTLRIQPSPRTAMVGETFLLDLAIDDALDLFDYQFDLLFNPAFLQVNGVSDGGFLTSGGGTSLFGGAFVLTLDNTTGLLTILDSLLGPAPPAAGVSGSGILATISFTALATGASAIGLANLTLEDAAGDPLAPISIDGSVDVSDAATIPEPATLVLVGSGLLVAARTARRRRVVTGRAR